MQCAAPAEHWAAFLCSTFSVISDAILHLLLREIYPCWHSTLVNVCTEEDEDDPYFDSSAFFSSIKLPWNYLNRRKRSMRWSYEDFFFAITYTYWIYIRHCQTWINWQDYLWRSSLISADWFSTIEIIVGHPNLTKLDTKVRSLNVFKFCPPFLCLLPLSHLHLYS